MSKEYKFPDGFYWGAATASYQVEGGIYNNDWAEAAKKTNKVPPAGESSDHYNRFEEDFDIAKSLGHNSQRISIEWSRIEQEEGIFNQKEIEHYREVLIAMKKRGLTPLVTLWHFTLPTWFSDNGGFLDKDAPEIFARYCEFVVDELGGDCHFWSTINEPLVIATKGYLQGDWPPFNKNIFKYGRVLQSYAKGHNLAYKRIKAKHPELEIGIVKDNIQFTADGKPWNKLSRAVVDWWWNRRFLNKIKNNLDTIGLNFYFHNQIGKRKVDYPKSDFGWDIDPEGIYHVLMDLKKYNKPIYISEAGIADKEDRYRAEYIKGLIRWTHEAITQGVDVKAFLYWSLIDNFEWAEGYDKHFGLVSFDHVTKERTIRESAYVYKKVCQNNTLVLE